MVYLRIRSVLSALGLVFAVLMLFPSAGYSQTFRGGIIGEVTAHRARP
jgi:hypothetical protein